MAARFLTFFICLAALPAKAGGKTLEIRFEDLPKLVKERNGTVLGAKQSIAAARARTGHLARSFLPSVSVRGGTESAKMGPADRQNQDFWSAEARLNIYRGGRDKIENQIIESRSRAAAARASGDYLSELKAARDNFWQLTATQLIIADLKEAIAKNEGNIQGAKRRAGAGVTTSSDRLHFELEQTILSQELKKMEHEEDVLKNHLSVQVGHEDHKNIRITAQFPHPPEAEFQEAETDTKKNPELNFLRESEETERLAAQQSGRWYLPKLDVYARHGVPSLGDDYARALRKETETVAGVVLSLDVGQVFQDRVNSRAQALESRAMTSRISQRASSLRAVSHELQHDLKLQHELIHDADRDVKKAEDFLKLTRSEYARGVKNGPDLLEAFTKLYAFRKRKIELNLGYQLAKSEFESLSAEGAEL